MAATDRSCPAAHVTTVIVGQIEEFVQAIRHYIGMLDQVDEGLLLAPQLLADEEGLDFAAAAALMG